MHNSLDSVQDKKKKGKVTAAKRPDFLITPVEPYDKFKNSPSTGSRESYNSRVSGSSTASKRKPGVAPLAREEVATDEDRGGSGGSKGSRVSDVSGSRVSDVSGSGGSKGSRVSDVSGSRVSDVSGSGGSKGSRVSDVSSNSRVSHVSSNSRVSAPISATATKKDAAKPNPSNTRAAAVIKKDPTTHDDASVGSGISHYGGLDFGAGAGGGHILGKEKKVRSVAPPAPTKPKETGVNNPSQQAIIAVNGNEPYLLTTALKKITDVNAVKNTDDHGLLEIATYNYINVSITRGDVKKNALLCINSLLAAGADPSAALDIKDSKGHGLLEIVTGQYLTKSKTVNESHQCIKSLLKAGADPSAALESLKANKGVLATTLKKQFNEQTERLTAVDDLVEQITSADTVEKKEAVVQSLGGTDSALGKAAATYYADTSEDKSTYTLKRAAISEAPDTTAAENLTAAVEAANTTPSRVNSAASRVSNASSRHSDIPPISSRPGTASSIEPIDLKAAVAASSRPGTASSRGSLEPPAAAPIDYNQTLYDAAISGYIRKAMEALSNGADLSARDTTNGNTAFHWAAAGGHTEIIQALADNHPTHVNDLNSTGDTPLHLAANKEVAKALIMGGAGHANINNDVQTPAETTSDATQAFLQRYELAMDIAEALGKPTGDEASTQAIRAAISEGYDNSEDFSQAMRQAQSEEPKDLIALAEAMAGLDIDEVKGKLKAAIAPPAADVDLLDSSRRSSTSSIESIAETASYPNDDLYEAVTKGNLSRVQAAIDAGAEIAIYDGGNTAFHMAAFLGHTEIIKALIEKYPDDIDTLNNYSQTPLALAQGKGHAEVANALMRAELINYISDVTDKPLQTFIQNEIGKTSPDAASTYKKNRNYNGVKQAINKISDIYIKDAYNATILAISKHELANIVITAEGDERLAIAAALTDVHPLLKTAIDKNKDIRVTISRTSADEFNAIKKAVDTALTAPAASLVNPRSGAATHRGQGDDIKPDNDDSRSTSASSLHSIRPASTMPKPASYPATTEAEEIVRQRAVIVARITGAGAGVDDIQRTFIWRQIGNDISEAKNAATSYFNNEHTGEPDRSKNAVDLIPDDKLSLIDPAIDLALQKHQIAYNIINADPAVREAIKDEVGDRSDLGKAIAAHDADARENAINNSVFGYSGDLTALGTLVDDKIEEHTNAALAAATAKNDLAYKITDAASDEHRVAMADAVVESEYPGLKDAIVTYNTTVDKTAGKTTFMATITAIPDSKIPALTAVVDGAIAAHNTTLTRAAAALLAEKQFLLKLIETAPSNGHRDAVSAVIPALKTAIKTYNADTTADKTNGEAALMNAMPDTVTAIDDMRKTVGYAIGRHTIVERITGSSPLHQTDLWTELGAAGHVGKPAADYYKSRTEDPTIMETARIKPAIDKVADGNIASLETEVDKIIRANVTATSQELIAIAATGTETDIIRLITDGADVNYKDPANGNTALHVAASPDIARALLKHGADITATNNPAVGAAAGTLGKTPAETTASPVKELLEKYAAAKSIIDTLNADAAVAATSAAYSTALKGAIATAGNPLNTGQIHAAITSYNTPGATQENKHDAILELATHLDHTKLPAIQAALSDGNRLHIAVTAADEAMVTQLAAKPGTLAHKDAAGNTALHIATTPAIATILLTKGADPAAKNTAGNTALHLATTEPIARVLLVNGSDITAKNTANQTPEEKATLAPVKELLQKYKLTTIIQDAVAQGSTPAQKKNITRSIAQSIPDTERDGFIIAVNKVVPAGSPTDRLALVDKITTDSIAQKITERAKRHAAAAPANQQTQNAALLTAVKAALAAPAATAFDPAAINIALDGGAELAAITSPIASTLGFGGNPGGDTALHLAAKAGNLAVVNHILDAVDRGGDTTPINQPNLSTETALHLAAKNGKKDVVAVLLDRGASINHEQLSPFKADMVNLLQRHQIAIDITDECRKDSTFTTKIPYHLRTNVENAIILELSAAIAKIRTDMAAMYNTPEKIASLRTTLNLPEPGKNPNEELINAVKSGNLERVKAGIINVTGKDPDLNKVKDKDGKTLMHLAAATGKSDIVSHLIQSGVSAHATDNDNHTPLHLAQGKDVVIALLPYLKADEINALNNVKSVGSITGRREYLNLVTRETPLHSAIRSGDNDVVYTLLQHSKINVSIADKDGNLPLHLAVKEGRQDVVATVLGNKAAAGTIHTTNSAKETPLYMAITGGNVQIVTNLLNAGAEIDQVAGKSQLTPIAYATQLSTTPGNQDVLELLENHKLATRFVEEMKTNPAFKDIPSMLKQYNVPFWSNPAVVSNPKQKLNLVNELRDVLSNPDNHKLKEYIQENMGKTLPNPTRSTATNPPPKGSGKGADQPGGNPAGGQPASSSADVEEATAFLKKQYTAQMQQMEQSYQEQMARMQANHVDQMAKMQENHAYQMSQRPYPEPDRQQAPAGGGFMDGFSKMSGGAQIACVVALLILALVFPYLFLIVLGAATIVTAGQAIGNRRAKSAPAAYYPPPVYPSSPEQSQAQPPLDKNPAFIALKDVNSQLAAENQQIKERFAELNTMLEHAITRDQTLLPSLQAAMQQSQGGPQGKTPGGRPSSPSSVADLDHTGSSTGKKGKHVDRLNRPGSAPYR